MEATVSREKYIFRWMRMEHVASIPKRHRYFTLVRRVHLPKTFKNKKNRCFYPRITKGKFKGHVGIGGLILARIPKFLPMLKPNLKYLKRRYHNEQKR